ncbi:MAG: GAF domain-containing protein [Asticcacaulis sp.]|uniref:GAF domain-containing protein n=1 Tax=Asticcacaulis sp. TaxID=1872648 RepID=UPI0039E28809
MPNTEASRLAALKRTGLLDSDPEPLFDQLTQLGARFLHMPTCLISLVDEDRQWFKSRVGLEVQSTPRDVAFCDHAIRGQSVMIVPDATKDPRFRDNKLVTEGIKIRFYAGAPITYEGENIGTVCVIDYRPNTQFGDREVAVLKHLAEMTAGILRKNASERDNDELLL